MCGIAGWIDWQENLKYSGDIISKMNETLAQRGPDAAGMWLSHDAAFGHRRLSVVDPVGGSQPMIKTLGDRIFVITYNGELYNTEDLRVALKARGHSFRSHSDTEVLLTSYIEWGVECVERFNGIYAFGIWDETEKSLFLARDRMGVKPLFYAQRGTSLIFGSELKTLLAHPMVKPEISSDGLAEVFALGPSRSPGHGVYKDVFEVRPGYWLLFNRDGLFSHKYWTLNSESHPDNLEVTTQKVRELVIDSIERQLVSDVPVCTFLSGGLDSSTISAVASEGFKKLDWGQLHTYSIDYVDNDKHFTANDFQPDPDSVWISTISTHIGSNHHNIVFDTPALVDALETAMIARDLPGMADIDSSLYLFCKEIKKDAVVALSGECADEVFGGYPWFHKKDALAANTFPWLRALDHRMSIFSKDILDVMKPHDYVASRYAQTLSEVPRLAGEDPQEARRREMFYLNITWFMNTLLDRKDRMSMATGLEVRVPFCDHRIVEYVWNIPWDMKTYGGREKGILRHAVKGLLPESIIERKKSPYPKTFNPSYTNSVRSKLSDILEDSSSPLLPLIDLPLVKSMVNNSDVDLSKPWFGQLMAGPQLFAYLIQVDMWLRHYKVSIK